MAKYDGFAHHHFTRVGFQVFGDQLQKGGFSGAVGPHDAHAFPAFEFVVKIFNEDFGAK